MVVAGSGTAALALDAGSFGRGLAPPRRVVSAGREQPMVTTHEFDDVFRTSYPRLVRLLTATTDDAELAADCVQEAFVRAHVRWRRIGEYEDPVGWVRRVALNLARDHARRAARKRKAKHRLAVEGEAQERSSAPAEQPVDLLDALRTLPTQQRTALALHYVEGLPVREVAAEMGLSEGAVKFHLHGGRERLRRTLEGVDEGGQRA
jgi:RNA polymerase sigma-70 factor (ECF subfamily)